MQGPPVRVSWAERENRLKEEIGCATSTSIVKVGDQVATSLAMVELTTTL